MEAEPIPDFAKFLSEYRVEIDQAIARCPTFQSGLGAIRVRDKCLWFYYHNEKSIQVGLCEVFKVDSKS